MLEDTQHRHASYLVVKAYRDLETKLHMLLTAALINISRQLHAQPDTYRWLEVRI
jgi:hypothetical protein